MRKNRLLAQKEQIALFRRRYIDTVNIHAQSMLHQSMPRLSESLFALFETTGNRLQYENVYFSRRKFLTVFGLLAIVEKTEDGCQETTVQKLAEILTEICEEECWALPAHVDRKNNPDWRRTIDLFACETAEALAEIVYRVGDKLPGNVVAQVRENVMERVLSPFFNSKVPYADWEHCEHNWNAVCNGAIGCAAIYLMQDEVERLNKYLERICGSLTHFVAGYGEDGACMEGLGYYTYGMSYFVGFAQELYEYTDGKIDLLADEKVQKMAQFQQKCFFDGGRSVSFSDGSSNERFRIGLTCLMALRFQTVKIPDMSVAAEFDADTCYRFMMASRDYLWALKYLDEMRVENTDTPEKVDNKEAEKGSVKYDIAQRHKKETVSGKVQVLPNAQWCIGNSENGISFACKGGHNNEPHNHNDVGSFMYVIDDEVFLDDLGAGEYTKDYFGPGRYEILCNSSLGHSVPVIHGQGQKNGMTYGCNYFEAKEETGKANITVEFAQAYEEGVVDNLCRDFSFDLETGVLRVTDRFVIGSGEQANGNAAHQFRETLITRIQPEIDGNQILLKGKGGSSCLITITPDMAHALICEVAGPVYEEVTHSNHEGITETIYIIRWDVKIDERNEGKSSWLIQKKK